jgi:hypothetical protein
MRSPLLPDLPPALERFVRELYPDETLARRALLAPWPGRGFRSVWQARALWQEPSQSEERRAFEGLLQANRERFFISVEQPYFPAEGTQGALRSPYAQLSDAEYWIYVAELGSEIEAGKWLHKPLEGLQGMSVLQWLDKAAHKGVLGRAIDALRDKPEPHAHAWSVLIDELHPSYNYT